MKKKLLIVLMSLVTLVCMISGCAGNTEKKAQQLDFEMPSHAYGVEQEPLITVVPLGNAEVTFLYAGVEGTTYASSSDRPTDVGTYKITGMAAETDEYTSKSVEKTYSITKADLAGVTFPTAASAPFGTKLSELTLSGQSGDGEFSFTQPETIPDVGVGQLFEMKFVPANANYNEITAEVKVTITPFEITALDFPVVTQELVYDPARTLKDVSLSFMENEYGAFEWSDENATPVVNGDGYLVKFVPSNVLNYDFSALPGYNAETKRVEREVEVTVTPYVLETFAWPEIGELDADQPLSQCALTGEAKGGIFRWQDPEKLPYDGESCVLLFVADDVNYDYSKVSIDMVDGVAEKTVTVAVNKIVKVPEGGHPAALFVNAPDYTLAKNMRLPEGYKVAEADAEKAVVAGKQEIGVYYNPDPWKYLDSDLLDIDIYVEDASRLVSTDKTDTVNVAASNKAVNSAWGQTAPEKVSFSSRFTENDTINISGVSAKGIYLVNFTWKTDIVPALAQPFAYDFKVRLYIENRKGGFDFKVGNGQTLRIEPGFQMFEIHDKMTGLDKPFYSGFAFSGDFPFTENCAGAAIGVVDGKIVMQFPMVTNEYDLSISFAAMTLHTSYVPDEGTVAGATVKTQEIGGNTYQGIELVKTGGWGRGVVALNTGLKMQRDGKTLAFKLKVFTSNTDKDNAVYASNAGGGNWSSGPICFPKITEVSEYIFKFGQNWLADYAQYGILSFNGATVGYDAEKGEAYVETDDGRKVLSADEIENITLNLGLDYQGEAATFFTVFSYEYE